MINVYDFLEQVISKTCLQKKFKHHNYYNFFILKIQKFMNIK